VRLWDLAISNPLGTSTGGRGSVSAVAFSPDGKKLAIGDRSGKVRLWDGASGKLGPPLTDGGNVSIPSVAVSPDGRTLAAGDTDGKVRLWDPTSGKLLHTLTTEGGNVRVASVAFSRDGKTLATAAGTAQLWDPPVQAQVCSLTWGNLTKADWDAIPPGFAYRTTCPS
jgi:WD40 repeat protein